MQITKENKNINMKLNLFYCPQKIEMKLRPDIETPTPQ
jgi:hypothetical protein